jgi:hypothetical protein
MNKGRQPRRAKARRWAWLGLALCLGAVPRAAQPASEAVDTALVLAVDVSRSVTPERYALQMDGLAKTFEDPEVQDAIFSGTHRSIAVTLVQWSDRAQLMIPWTLIASRHEALVLAERIRQTPRSSEAFTCLSVALQLIQGKVLPFLPVATERSVIDVSGDGHDNCNSSVSVDSVRDSLVASGQTINGLPILEGEEADTLEQWYSQHVIGGAGAFLLPAAGFADFARAMRRKFITEISALKTGRDG